MSSFINKYNKDYYGGGLMMLIGLGAAFQGKSYKIGSLIQMGSGFFPVALGLLLALVGAAIALSAKRPAAISQEPEKHLPPEWRGWICIALSIVAFVVLGQYGGLMPATFAIVFISALGDRQNNVKTAIVLALAMCAICAVVFWWALDVSFPLFRWG
jgi:hypothetical protein